MKPDIFKDYGDILGEVRTAFITRNLETNGPEPLLDDLAAEFDLPLAILRKSFAREDWDLLRQENQAMFKKSYLKARETAIESQALDLAKEMSSIMRRRINFLKDTGLLIDAKIQAILEDPERELKLDQLIKLKELWSKEVTGVTDVFIKLQEKLNKTPGDDIKTLTSADYLAQLRTAVEVARALKDQPTEDPPEAAELFRRLDQEREAGE